MKECEEGGETPLLEVLNPSIHTSLCHLVYWRLLRRISEEGVIKTIIKADPSYTRQQALHQLAKWYHQDVQHVTYDSFEDEKLPLFATATTPTTSSMLSPSLASAAADAYSEYLRSDMSVMRWLGEGQGAVEERVASIQAESIKKQITNLMLKDAQSCVDAIGEMLMLQQQQQHGEGGVEELQGIVQILKDRLVEPRQK